MLEQNFPKASGEKHLVGGFSVATNLIDTV